ncbi:MAG: hypothetical protein Kow00117_20590 [Phototrophicales bacterium]
MIDIAGKYPITAAVIQEGKITWMLEQGADAQTRFPIGTLNELFIVIAVLQRIRAGELDLHAEGITPHHSVTLHHLMTHTSGYGAARSWRALLFKQQTPLKQHHPAGGKWCYSKDNIALLRDMLPPDYLHRHVFKPLGMHATTETESTLEDMLKLVGELLAPGRVMAVGDVMMMTTPHFQHHPALPAMGYGFRLEDGVAWMTSKTGGLWIAPEQKTAIVALARGAFSGACRAAMRRLISAPSYEIVGDAPALRGGYYAPSPGLLMNLPIWLSYGGGLTVGRQGTLNGQIDPMHKIKLTPTTQTNVFLLPNGSRVVIDDERVLIGLYELHRRPWLHSLGGKLSIFTLLVFVIFLIILLAIFNF